MFKMLAVALLLVGCFVNAVAQESTSSTRPARAVTETKPVKIEFEYKLLATSRVSTMEKEMKEAAEAGYHFIEVVSGPTFFGGSEAMVVMGRQKDANHKQRFDYKLLATTKTSTMEKELQEAGDAGYEHRGQSVFKKTFGSEVIAILERDLEAKPKLWEYKLLATKRTSTMQKEVAEAAEAGYELVGFTYGSTFFGGNEVVTIMRRPRGQ
jgi:hypothetical protein